MAMSPTIITMRGQRVMIDADLAALYGVSTKRFNEAVKRNLSRCSADFMFVLDALARATQEQLQQVFDALRQLMAPPDPPRRPMGFVTSGT